jgi:hypothetical protein
MTFLVTLLAPQINGLENSLWACPFCGSDTGRQVRANVFGDDFWINAASVVSPVAVLLFIAIALWYVASQET